MGTGEFETEFKRRLLRVIVTVFNGLHNSEFWPRFYAVAWRKEPWYFIGFEISDSDFLGEVI